MERYLGMDVHAASSTICVLNERGKLLRRDVVETHGEALVGYLKQQPGTLHLCFEEGEWAGWLHEILSPHVADLVVLHGVRKSGSKSDAIDARDLADRLRTGRIERPIFKAPGQYAKLRELSRAYTLMTRDCARAKNRLKSTYRRRGLSCSGTSVLSPGTRVKREQELPLAARGAAELLGISLDCAEELKQEAEAAMVREAHRQPISRVLETVPGMGPVRVAQLLPIVVTPHRFRSKRQFWSYCGLGVVTRSSADWVRHGDRWTKAQVAQTRGLNRNYNRTLKMIFKGAATTVITHAAPNRFCEAYERLCRQGTKPNLAKVTVARQLAATVLAMWKAEEVFDPKR